VDKISTPSSFNDWASSMTPVLSKTEMSARFTRVEFWFNVGFKIIL
jgi:hypothetical protein